jgi:hypothetical protein
MDKRFFVAWLLVFIVWFAGSFVVHGLLLHDDYARLANLFRPEAEAQQYFHWMVVAHLMLSGALVWIYSRAAEDKPWPAQGVRFGIAAALLSVVPWYLIYHVVQPMPGATAAKQILFDGVLVIALSVITAFMYRKRA